LVISTPDRVHVPQAVTAMRLGYDLLLEKPISDSREEINLLLKTQKETGKQVMVCHVLRFGPGYRKCKEILDSGVLGRLYAIDASERVVYWHWAQAYVRCIGALAETGHPTILAKCSHDLDLLQFYADSKCDTMSSFGELGFFKAENAPEGAAERCVDCQYIDTCPFSAKRIYIDLWHKKGEPEYLWPFYRACDKTPITEQGLYEGLKEKDVGRCAFRCPVDHADHQMLQMQFENGVKASLKMVFAARSGRRIVFYGTMGEMIVDEREDSITVMPFGGETEVFKIGALLEGGHAHGGGDAGIVEELYEMLSGKAKAITSLERSVECHLMGIAAEESRKDGGKTVKVHQ
ncbi:MAG: Gfo/Idh/MocA family oxidoreductase, partial [Clostridia bacterium]|nr:Gfo/Idh/MocA family oxidoreductase [Clostridia bacterium]